MDVRFLVETQEEFLDQVAYYEEREPGMGERFRFAVQAATTLAATHPKLGSPWKLRTRRVFLKGFNSRSSIPLSQRSLWCSQ